MPLTRGDGQPVKRRPEAAGTGLALQLPVALVSVFAPLNSTMIAIGLPSIGRDLGVGAGAITLLVSAYLIAVAVCQPAGGRLGDAFGHVRMMKAGLCVLVVFSLAGALAWNFPVLVATRSLQGISAALITPNAVAYLRKQVPVERLGSALGTNGAVLSAAAAIGPILGGVLLQVSDWRILMVANLPLAAITWLLVMRLPPDRGAGRSALRLDTVSLLALLAGFTGITIFGNALRLHLPLLLGLAVALFVLGAGGYALHYRRTRSGVVDLRLFARRNYVAPALGNGLNNCVVYTTLVALPIYLGDLEGMSDFASATALFVMGVMTVIVAPFAGLLSDRLGPRPLLTTGAGLLLLSAIAMIGAAGGMAFALLLVPLLFMGMALGLISGPQQALALRSLPSEQAGSGAGTYSMMRYVGSVIGTALLAGAVGKHATHGEFQVLFVILSGVAASNLFVTLLIRGHAPNPAASAQPAPAIA